MPEYDVNRLNRIFEAHRKVEPIFPTGDRPCDTEPDPNAGTEFDPNGLDAHDPGAKLDAGKPRMGLVMQGFPRALLAVGVVATVGAAKYSDGGWLTVKEGFERYTDAMHRHILEEAIDGVIDPKTDLNHAAQVAWNALARLELLLRRVGK